METLKVLFNAAGNVQDYIRCSIVACSFFQDFLVLLSGAAGIFHSSILASTSTALGCIFAKVFAGSLVASNCH